MTTSFARRFAMPRSDTLTIPEIASWAKFHLQGRIAIVDPFARNCRLGTFRNDLDDSTAAEHHMDAEDFCASLHAEGISCDAGIFDPPYSPGQISECYSKVGLKVGMQETQNAALYKRVRDSMHALMKPGAVVLSFGWNSNGMGLERGYTVRDILLVQHGGAHNDTICMAEVYDFAQRDLLQPPRQ